MKLFVKNVICLIVTIALMSSAFAWAYNDHNTTGQAKVGGEIIELRGKNTETFLLSDGTYECIVYSEDKYYEDEKGNLSIIDNSIVDTDYTKEGIRYIYKNNSNAMSVFFSDETPSVLINCNDHDLSFSLIDSNKSTALVGESNPINEYTGNIILGDNSILYPEILNSVDLLYTVNNLGIKEYIVLKDRTATSSFSFIFDTSNYSIRTLNSGQIGFFNTDGERLFELGKLYAFDSSGNYTDDLCYTVNEMRDGKTIVSVTIANEFLNDNNRVFPILIDPSVMITGDSNTYDTYVSSTYNTTNYYLNTYLRTGKSDGYGICRTYIKFNLPTNIAGNCVSSSYINIKKSDGVAPSVRACRVTAPWNSSTVTWNNKPSFTLTDASEYSTLDSNDWYRLYVTQLVRKWLDNTYNNYGFVIKESTETGTTQWTSYYSSDAASPNKPELHIFYSSYTVNPVSVRKITDSTYREEYTNYISKINAYMTEIRTPFNLRWNIEFSHDTWVNNTTLPAADCSLANNQRCCDYKNICGTTCTNSTDTPNHHKNHYRNYYLLKQSGPGSADITIGFFGFRPCASGGLGITWLATVCQPQGVAGYSENYNRRTLQHEISHLFGCHDFKPQTHPCTDGQLCIMRGSFDNIVSMDQSNIWCDLCASEFDRDAH